MKIKHYIIILSAAIFLSSCARVMKEPIQAYPPQEVYPQTLPAYPRQNIYHEVAPGETLWRISKMYDVDISSIQNANKIYGTIIETGVNLLIPNAAPIRTVIPLYKSYKWRYIIVHHTATDSGSSLTIDQMHKNRGWEGVGYHFVIDNGTGGKENGQIEVTPRWIKQQDGAHCKASEMNYKSIGIALVGNFSSEKLSQKQFDALVFLINLLAEKYKIPRQNIMGHGQVPGAATECPGTNFSWKEFYSKLK